MKRSLLFLLMGTFCVTLLAQEAADNQQQQEFKIPYDDMDKVKIALNLSDEQLEKWNEVNNKYYPTLKELELQDSLDIRAKSSKLRKVIEDRDTELKEFIFAAQWDKYQSMKMQARREEMKGRREEMMKRRKEMMEKRKQGKDKEGDGGNQ